MMILPVFPPIINTCILPDSPRHLQLSQLSSVHLFFSSVCSPINSKCGHMISMLCNYVAIIQLIPFYPRDGRISGLCIFQPWHYLFPIAISKIRKNIIIITNPHPGWKKNITMPVISNDAQKAPKISALNTCPIKKAITMYSKIPPIQADTSHPGKLSCLYATTDPKKVIAKAASLARVESIQWI